MGLNQALSEGQLAFFPGRFVYRGHRHTCANTSARTHRHVARTPVHTHLCTHTLHAHLCTHTCARTRRQTPVHTAPFPIPAVMLPNLGLCCSFAFRPPVLMLFLLVSSCKIQDTRFRSLSAKPSPHHTQLIHQLNYRTSGDPEESVVSGRLGVFVSEER